MVNPIRMPAATTWTAEQALQSALNDAEIEELTDVLIIGYNAAGDLYIRSSRLTRAQALFLCMKAVRWAEGHDLN